MSGMTPALVLAGIHKVFDGQVALRGADFSLRRGEIHALLGENGAGKSTLMNIVCGLYRADRGQSWVRGKPVHISGPGDAIGLGIGMVHQHFKLVAPFTIAENMLLTCARLGLRSLGQARSATREAAASLGFDLKPDDRICDLSIAERQRVEILKLVMLGADILILDEPTAVLTDREADGVLQLMRTLASRGRAVVLITHRLREAIGHADRVTVMRAGQTVLDGAPVAEHDAEALTRLMIGEMPRAEESFAVASRESAPLLEVTKLNLRRPDGSQALVDISFTVGAGEILGIAGVGGNGQTELTETLFGLRMPDAGTALLAGKPMASNILLRRRQGLRLIPADRYGHALLADLRAYENLALTAVTRGRYGPWWWLRRRAMQKDAARIFAERSIKGGGPLTPTRLLSGGNAQKLLLARELDEDARVLIAHSPTRGLDVRACQAVHETMRRKVAGGETACLLISEDLDEILKLSSRVAVMNRGRLHGPFPRACIDREAIGTLMVNHA